MSKILVIGTGAFGTALANVLLQNNHIVNMYGNNDTQLDDLKKGYNKEFFGNKKLFKKPNLITTNFAEASKGVDVMIIAIPSKYIQDTLKAHKKYIKTSTILVNSSKGIDPISRLNYFELIRKIFPRNKICSLVGPSFAKELFDNNYTVVNAVSKDIKTAQKISKMFETKYFKVKPISDEIGASLASALKNGLAVCCGMLHELKYPINTISAVITKGVSEIANYCHSQGGNFNTTIQYCSIGDIYLTCSSDQSRNFKLGQRIAKYGFKKALSKMNLTLEGIEIIKAIYPNIKNNNDYILFNLLYKLIDTKIEPKNFIETLWKII